MIDILYAEDNQAHVELLHRALRKTTNNPTLMHVPDGREALDYLYRRGDYEHLKSEPLPRLILLAQRMPKMDGHQVLRIVKEDRFLCHIPVVILGVIDADILNQNDSLCADSYLVKPADASQFAQMVETLCHRYLK